MEKWMCWGAMGVSGLLLLLFVLDASPMKFPFDGLNIIVDIVSALACAIVFYLAWDAYSDLR